MAAYERFVWESGRGPLPGWSEQGMISAFSDGGVMVLRLMQTPILDPDQMLTIEGKTSRIW